MPRRSCGCVAGIVTLRGCESTSKGLTPKANQIIGLGSESWLEGITPFSGIHARPSALGDKYAGERGRPATHPAADTGSLMQNLPTRRRDGSAALHERRSRIRCG